MGILATLNTMTFSAAAIAAGQVKSEDLVGMLEAAKIAAAELSGACATTAKMIPSADPNYSTLNLVAALNQVGAVLNFGDRFESGLLATML